MSETLGGVHIKLTPLLGGREDGAICTLLEVGKTRILLDCGCCLGTSPTALQNMKEEIVKGGPIDAVLLSHADLAHIGGLPILFGEHGNILRPIVVYLSIYTPSCFIFRVAVFCANYMHPANFENGPNGPL